MKLWDSQDETNNAVFWIVMAAACAVLVIDSLWGLDPVRERLAAAWHVFQGAPAAATRHGKGE